MIRKLVPFILLKYFGVDTWSRVYTTGMVALSDEQRAEIAEYGTPLPIIEPDDGKAYIVLGVSFTRLENGSFRAVAPGVNAVGEGDLPSDALFALCAAIQALADT